MMAVIIWYEVKVFVFLNFLMFYLKKKYYIFFLYLKIHQEVPKGNNCHKNQFIVNSSMMWHPHVEVVCSSQIAEEKAGTLSPKRENT